MKINPSKKILTFLVLSFISVVVLAEIKSPATWQSEFEKLSPGMPRLEAENEIARIRKVKSTYDLRAMDLSSLVPYKLDPETILLVIYKPGSPAARGINGQGGKSPVDGSLIRFDVLKLR